VNDRDKVKERDAVVDREETHQLQKRVKKTYKLLRGNKETQQLLRRDQENTPTAMKKPWKHTNC
jgi:ribosomal protein L7Ae-like RNA K-turn-binding protein